MDGYQITIISKGGDTFQVTPNVARMMKAFDKYFHQSVDGKISKEDEQMNSTSNDIHIPCPGISSSILAKVIEFCTYYQTVEKMKDIKRPLESNMLRYIVKQDWYAKFVEDIVDQRFLFRLINAANYLNVEPLLNLTVLATAVRVDGKSEDEVRSMFHFLPLQMKIDNKY